MKLNKIRMSIAALALGVLLIVPMTASAQRNSGQQGGGNWNNGRGRGDDHRGQNYHIKAMVDDAERDSNAMRHAFEHSMNRWRNFDTDRNDRGRNGNQDRNGNRDWDRRSLTDVKSSIQRLDESMESLRRVADDYRPRAGRDEMREVLKRAEIFSDYFARRRDVREAIGDRWDHLRVDLNKLARAYGLDNVNR